LHSLTRRGLLGRAALLAGGMATQRTALQAFQAASRADQVPLTLDANTLAHYVDPLPIPQIARPNGVRASPTNPGSTNSGSANSGPQLPFYRMEMRPVEVKVHRDLDPARIWGFGSSSPGPTFETRSGQGLIVEWANELPAKHFLPIDHTLHGAESSLPEVRSVIHLHGGKTPPHSDGYPEDWCVPGKSLMYHYPNQQDACLLFYHDHTMGINRLNIYAGLFGLFVIRDAREDALGLPAGEYEVPLLIYDRFLRPDGHLDVEPRKYRLRIMNASNGRFYRFSFGQKLPFQVIGTEQGFLDAAADTNRVVMAPAERIDAIFDFSAHAGEKILLVSDSLELMEFRVAAKPSPRRSAGNPPIAPHTFVRLAEHQAIKTRRLTLDERMDRAQQSMGMLLNNTPWHMPITEKPLLDSIEIWELVNLTNDSHPIHLHLVRFQILDRRAFDTFDFQDKGTLRFMGPAIPPEPTEAGWKDTVRADPGVVTRIIIPFTGFTGRYVWHCHILEHEDNEMMRPYEVVPASGAV
jgi:spore coat protein A, manganese oxidase